MVSVQVGVLLAVVALAQGAPQYSPQYSRPYYNPTGPTGAYSANYVPIESQNYDLNPDGSYTFSYRSADGSARDEVGAPRASGPEGPAVTVQGSYSYQSPEGPVEVSYIADENGYQPQGNNIHPAIVKAVALQVAQARGQAPGVQYTGAYNGNPAYNPNAYNPNAYNPNAYNPNAYNRNAFRQY